jgi:co-chaperonin GroES (HSP10)
MKKRNVLDVKVFGERVLFEPVHEEMTGSIVMPEKAQKKYELGRVLKVGDGKSKDKDGKVKKTKMIVKPGDIVQFQVNPMMAASCSLRLEGITYLNVLQHDLLARLSGTKVTFQDFEIIGAWVLLGTFEDVVPDQIIQLPGSVENPEVRFLRYFVVQRGGLVDDENIQIGTEVIVDRRAPQLISINGMTFFITDYRHIYGMVEPTPLLAAAKSKHIRDLQEVTATLQTTP